MKRFWTASLLCVIGWCFLQESAAQVAVTLKKNNVQIKSEPRLTSETLVTLRSGTRVLVRGRNGDWLKVTVNYSGFDFTGWIEKSAFVANSNPSRPVQPRIQPPPPQNNPSAVDQFFDSGASRPSSSAPPAFDPSPHRTGGNSWLHDKLKLNAGLGLVFLSYKVSGTGAGETGFSYSLSGLGLDFLAQYDFWKSASARWAAGADIGYEYVFFLSKTQLQFTDNTSDTRNNKNTAGDLNLRVKLTHKLKQTLDVGASLGFKLLKFNGDDVLNNSGTGIRLYVSSSLITIPIGLFGTYRYGKYEGNLGVNLLMLNSYSESPDGASGTNPSPGIGLNPYLNVHYVFNPTHRVGFFYELLSQSVSFDGPTVTRATTFTLTNAEVTNRVHSIGFNYQYRF